ncbi:hypothetical protein NDU88_010383 [Pleurodeles waltl]|uniref:Uncharacterized protein n=1 Tax=Pleurodeles waltl TaxID=8319 RepID=A0AAV7PUZ5_PLEWA|nr:hypothetical protein NDU88_010383 [Pleurodeles waltl]
MGKPKKPFQRPAAFETTRPGFPAGARPPPPPPHLLWPNRSLRRRAGHHGGRNPLRRLPRRGQGRKGLLPDEVHAPGLLQQRQPSIAHASPHYRKLPNRTSPRHSAEKTPKAGKVLETN